MTIKLGAGLLAAFADCAFGGARAEEPAKRQVLATLYIAPYLDGTLALLPVQVFGGQLQLRSATLFQLDVGYAFAPFAIPIPFCANCAIRGNRIELHMAAGQYAGRQTNAEIGAYAMFRTGQIGIAAGLQANAAAGWGISYALDTTGVEFGRQNAQRQSFQGVNTYRTQFQIPIEVEWWHSALGRWSVLLPRIHHRSGAYGALAPSGSGSNFIGAGLRASW